MEDNTTMSFPPSVWALFWNAAVFLQFLQMANGSLKKMLEGQYIEHLVFFLLFVGFTNCLKSTILWAEKENKIAQKQVFFGGFQLDKSHTHLLIKWRHVRCAKNSKTIIFALKKNNFSRVWSTSAGGKIFSRTKTQDLSLSLVVFFVWIYWHWPHCCTLHKNNHFVKMF